MSRMMRIKVRWSGYQGGPGYNVLHFAKFGDDTFTATEATNCAVKARAFYDAIKAYLPNAVKIDVMPDVDIITDSDGKLYDTLTATPGATVTGTAGAGAQFAAAAGMVVNWRTTQVRNGRRIRGKSFIVPLANTGFAVDGTLDTGLVTAANTAATTLRTAGTDPALVVFARPSGPGATDGSNAIVTAHNIPDMSAVLRSRRD